MDFYKDSRFWIVVGVVVVILVVLAVILSWASSGNSNSLSGKNEVPPNKSPGYGSVVTKLAKDPNNGGRMSLFYDIYATDLTSPVISSHFHLGKSGISGPILKPITLKQQMENNKNVYRSNGIWDLTMQNSDNTEQPSMSHQQIIDALRNENIYYNVHTERYPAGELRTQITKF